MEMMDTQAAVRWFDDSVVLMMALRKRLESYPKDETDPLRREVIASARDFVEAMLKASYRASIAITHQMSLELPLLLAHAEAFAALRRAENLYAAESDKTWLVFKQTAPTYPEPPRFAITDDIEADLNELEAKYPAASASTGVRAS
jgi:hypothetical protein